MLIIEFSSGPLVKCASNCPPHPMKYVLLNPLEISEKKEKEEEPNCREEEPNIWSSIIIDGHMLSMNTNRFLLVVDKID